MVKMLPNLGELRVRKLDLTRNPIKIDNYLLDSLFSLRTLEHLSIDGT